MRLSRSISARMTLVIMLVSGLALLLAYISFLAYDVYNLRQDLINSLNTEAEIVGANSVTALVFQDPQAAENTLSGLRGSPHVESAVIVLPNGRSFARYRRDSGVSIAAEQPKLDPNQRFAYWRMDGEIVLARSIVFDDRVLGVVYLTAETSELKRGVWQFGLISAGVLMLCFVASLLATSTVRKLITRPLGELARTAQTVTRDQDYSVRAAVPNTGDELSFLIDSFNRMLEQIQQRDRALEAHRSQLEQRVGERTAELAAANQELEAFSSAVAHDLRGPLQQLTDIAFLLNGLPEFADDGQAAQLVQLMLETSKRMGTLIDDLLNLSRATNASLNRTEVDLSVTATKMLKALHLEYPGRKVEVKVAPGANVIADAGLMSLIMENLLRNAWKYTSRKDLAWIEFGFTDEAGQRVFFVRDNGVGFDPQYGDRLFRPFQRLHSQADFPGTGVGLATVKRIIARHGGTIWAEGVVDEGAVFRFTVPESNEAGG